MAAVGLPLTDAKRRIVDHLKRASPATTRDLADLLGASDVAARQHLAALEAAGLVAESTAAPAGRGRPRSLWSLTETAWGLFPDRHGDFSLGLLAALRTTVGDEGLEAIIDVQGDRQLAELRQALAGVTTIGARVTALADQRSRDGYMADVRGEADGAVTLLEHHCPIREAAAECPAICRSELEVFQAALGSDVRVERTEHLLAGGRRCVYRISPIREVPSWQ